MIFGPHLVRIGVKKRAFLPPGIKKVDIYKKQGGDSSAGTQALPVEMIIETKVCRKDNPKVSQI